MRTIPTRDRPSDESHDAGNHKHGSDDPQGGVSVAAALRREHPELRACRLPSSLATIDGDAARSLTPCR